VGEGSVAEGRGQRGGNGYEEEREDDSSVGEDRWWVGGVEA